MWVAGLLALVAVLAPLPAVAGDDPDGMLQARRNPPPDFLFGRPRASIGLRGGWTFARAGSDWFDFVTDELTVDKPDFHAGSLVGDVGVSIAPRFEAVFAADWASTAKDSEFRHYVDNNRNPINQTTEVRQAAFTAGLRYTLTDRGRELSSLAWIPRRLVPYVGGGAGVLWYRVQQYGDFVDYEDFSVFRDALDSSGFTPTAYANGGLDLHVFRHLWITFDARYLWASPKLDNEWRGFDPLDLTNVRLSTGVNILF